MDDLQDVPAEGAPNGGPGPRALRNTALVLTARVASRLLALVTVVVMANHLGDARFGDFQTLINISGVVAVLIDLGFNTLFVREAARHPGELSRYLSNLVTARLLFAVPALVVFAGVLWARGFGSLLVPGFVLMVAASYSGLLHQAFYARQRVGFEAIAIVLESVVLIAVTLAGVLTHQGIAYFIWAYAISYGFTCGFFLVVLAATGMARIRWRLEPDLVRTWLWKGLPFALTFVITTIYFKIDVPILQAFHGSREAGWYAFAYKPFEALLFVPITMLNVVFPVISVFHREAADRVPWAVERFYRSLLLLGWPITVGTFMLTPGIARAFHMFPPSEPALRILSLGIVLMFVNNAFIAALNSIDRQVSFTYAALATMVVNLVLNFALIPPYGYLGASWATVLTELALLAAGWWLTARHLAPMPLPRLSWRILLAGLAMGVVLIPMRGFQGLSLGLAVLAAVAAYAAALALLRAIDPDEVALARRALRVGA